MGEHVMEETAELDHNSLSGSAEELLGLGLLDNPATLSIRRLNLEYIRKQTDRQKQLANYFLFK